MRLPAVMLAAALAACQVDVEGAICAVPGDASECPSGQACGVDGRCSTRAASCTAPELRCTPDVDRRCSADAKRVETCTRADPCGAWEVTAAADDCSAAQLVCAAGACACPMPAGEIVVDVASPEGGLAPSGAADPPECRFKQLGPALSYAAGEWQPAHAGAPVTVRAVGAPTPEAPVVFEDEGFPLSIGSGVTLTTASASDPSLWIIAAAPSSGAVDVVEMHSGAALEGFTVRSVSASMGGIVAACGVDTVPVALNSVRIEGSGVLQYGLVVTGTCGIEGTAVHVDGAAKAGVLVNTASPVDVTLTGGSIRNSGESGVELLGGAVALAGNGTPFEVHSNARHGIRVAPAQPNPRAVTLSLALADVHDNGEVGILVKELGGSSSVSITSTLIRKNTGKSPLSVYGTGRIAGGMLLWGDAPQSFAFHGNTICGNATDQIGVFSDDDWPLAAPDCGTSNVFAAPGAGYYVYSTTELPAVEVPAQNNRWAPNPPTGLVVKANVAPSCGVATPPPACN